MSKRLLAGVFVLAVAVAACGTSTTPTTSAPTTSVPAAGSVIAEFKTPDGVSYRILLDGEAADQARAAKASGEGPGIPNGKINRGDGGINTGHDWHITDVEFADMAIEVCDGNAGYIDELGYDEFVSQHGDHFCPWGAELIDLIES